MNQDYERNHSHTHCWNQKSPACGQPLEDHKQCCLCDLRYKQTEEHSKCCGKKKIACALSPKPESEDWDRTKAHSEDLADRFTEAQQEEWIKEFEEMTKHWFYGTDIREIIKAFLRTQIGKAEKRGIDYKAYQKVLADVEKRASERTKASIIEMLHGMKTSLDKLKDINEGGLDYQLEIVATTWNKALDEAVTKINDKK